jgi:hypothetical protein
MFRHACAFAEVKSIRQHQRRCGRILDTCGCGFAEVNAARGDGIVFWFCENASSSYSMCFDTRVRLLKSKACGKIGGDAGVFWIRAACDE